VNRCIALFLVALLAAGATSLAADAATAQADVSMHVVTLDGFRLGGRKLLGRTPIQITSSFGRPDARVARTVRGRVTSLDLRYGATTIRFKRRAGDGRLLSWAARSTDRLLVGARGTRLLAPWFGGLGIQGALVREVGGVDAPEGNDWILRQPYSVATRTGMLVSGDYPRTITWGISGSTRWLQLATDLNVEYRAPAS
jgi:hypothetical protein